MRLVNSAIRMPRGLLPGWKIWMVLPVVIVPTLEQEKEKLNLPAEALEFLKALGYIAKD